MDAAHPPKHGAIQPDLLLHARGASLFIDDIPEPAGTLHACVVASPSAHGLLRRLDVAEARALPGVAGIFTAPDIPGRNQIGSMLADEELLASGTVHYAGQPLALIVAESAPGAAAAARRVIVEIDAMPAVFDAREAFAQGQIIGSPRMLESGDVEAAFSRCDVIVEGRADTGAQEHLYLETQSALAIPGDGGTIMVHSSTQRPAGVQRAIAAVLGIAMHRVEVDVQRCGGAFGGKEDQATAWAVLAALGAQMLHRPVKLVLRRHDDMRFTGKRHPYSADYRLGLRRDGTILAYDAAFYQNAGAACDLSPAILERTVFHATNAYRIPNARIRAWSCRSNLPPFTAFRGFGAPQAMFVLEAAIAHAATELGMPCEAVQRKNLLRDGDRFPFGMEARDCRADVSWEALDRADPISGRRAACDAFNRNSERWKRGMAVMPICFGISFTTAFLNQASALVHIYTDGSVAVSSGAVEMGQGVARKLRRVASRVLSLAEERITVTSTNTGRVANTSPTAASSGADLNGRAVQHACGTLLGRLLPVAAAMPGIAPDARLRFDEGQLLANDSATGITWNDVVTAAYHRRVALSAQGHFATPGIAYDRATERGTPFAYHVYGCARIDVTIDALLGTCTVDAVRAVHDAGIPLDALIDRGQAEGAIVQGIGWMTMEELLFGGDGRLLTDTLSTYKVPDINGIPRDLTVTFLERAPHPGGLHRSKAVGEPPFMYGIGVYFAILDAMRAFRPSLRPFFSAPMTAEKLLLALHDPLPARSDHLPGTDP